MNYFKYCFVLVILFILPTDGKAQQIIKANPTRPSVADNAYLSAYGHTELEFGWHYAKDSWNVPTLLKFTFHRKFELGISMSGLVNYMGSDVKLGNPGIQLKSQLIKTQRTALAVAGRVEFDSDDKPRYILYSVISTQTDLMNIDATIGKTFYDHGDGLYKNHVHYAVALSPNLKGRIGGFVEIFGEYSLYSKPVSFDCGISYVYSPRIVLDLSVTVGLNADAPDFILQMGFTSTLFRIF